ncbi:MAG: NAD(P)H-hydrate epimerase, partial [Pseudomonadota bacterium]
MTILLTAEEMRRAEAAAIADGHSGAAMMEAAGEGVAALIKRGWDKRAVAIACGPGNNGGDGFVIARHLKEAGWSVRVGSLGERTALKGDAASMAGRFDGDIEPLSPTVFDGAGLIVDALFGAGLSRPLEGETASIVSAMNNHAAPVVAVDIPSGVNPDSGAVAGDAVRAARTGTFFTKKPGHVLFPGRAFCGAVDVLDIGVKPAVFQEIKPKTAENTPQLWGGAFPRPTFQSHKYSRGAAAVFTGPRFATGAARLSAIAALRAGAGLVTLVSPMSAADENAAHATALMVKIAENAEHVAELLRDPRIRAALIGPGAGVAPATMDKVLAILNDETAAVLDADALTSFENAPEPLFDALNPDDIITPHEGEFMRLFTGLIESPKARLSAARAGAQKAGCIVVLKGPDAVGAAAGGRASVLDGEPPDVAAAGAGAVLAGG